MPHNISGNPVLLDSPLAKATPRSQLEFRREPVQVDTFADRLMDDLFEDVEKLLEGSVPPPEPVNVEPPQAISFDIAPSPGRSELVPLPNLPQWKPQEELPEVKKLVKRKPEKVQSGAFPKILVFAVFASAVAAVSLWLANRGILQRLTAVANQPSQAVATTPKVIPVDTNAQFAQYMQRSLAAIDRRVASSKPGTPLPTAPYNSRLPSVPVAKDAAKSDSTLPRTPVVINVPSAPAPSNTSNAPASPTELNQILTRLSSVLERLSPVLNRPANVPQVAPVARVSTAPAEPQRTLRGIAIASDPTQSAVLFEMNGVTQRYYIGESIGSSGWSVVDISNNYVSVRRNGEVRSISIGQKL